MVETADAECLQATLGSCSTNSCRIRQCGLVVCAACTGDSSLQAWLSSAGREASAAVQCCLGLCGSAAVQAALLAPTKEAGCLAILGGILTIGSIALGATT